jgi:uncharacterized protein YecE (DUF72 family)
MPVCIGTSGWQYRSWRGPFYPDRLSQRHWLEHYASRFQFVEVNNAFYRLPDASTFESKRLKDPAEPVSRFMERASHLGPKLGPVLVQLPPTLQKNLGALDDTLRLFPAAVRVAVEFRHDSWFADETYQLLTDRNAALCLADSPRRRTPVRRTAPWGYVRFHEGRATPHPCYGRTALDTWSRRLADLWGDEEDVYAFFNNDGGGCAVRDARTFRAAVRRAGRTPTRVPGPGDVKVR